MKPGFRHTPDPAALGDVLRRTLVRVDHRKQREIQANVRSIPVRRQRVRVWFGVRSGWWRWQCPCCPQHIGGFCNTWQFALKAARQHVAYHQSLPVVG